MFGFLVPAELFLWQTTVPSAAECSCHLKLLLWGCTNRLPGPVLVSITGSFGMEQIGKQAISAGHGEEDSVLWEENLFVCVINCCLFFYLAFSNFLSRNVPVMTSTIPCFCGKVYFHMILPDSPAGRMHNACCNSLSPLCSPRPQAVFLLICVLFPDCCLCNVMMTGHKNVPLWKLRFTKYFISSVFFSKTSLK